MSFTGADFVAWDATKNSFVQYPRGGVAVHHSLEETIALVEAPDEPEVAKLIEELTLYFGRIGMHAVCKSCFAGTLDTGNFLLDRHHRPGIGCCAPCVLQGHESCLKKPLGCALWMCGYTRDKFPAAAELMERIRSVLWRAELYPGYFADPRLTKLSMVQRVAVRRAIRMLRAAEKPK